MRKEGVCWRGGVVGGGGGGSMSMCEGGVFEDSGIADEDIVV